MQSLANTYVPTQPHTSVCHGQPSTSSKSRRELTANWIISYWPTFLQLHGGASIALTLKLEIAWRFLVQVRFGRRKRTSIMPLTKIYVRTRRTSGGLLRPFARRIKGLLSRSCPSQTTESRRDWCYPNRSIWRRPGSTDLGCRTIWCGPIHWTLRIWGCWHAWEKCPIHDHRKLYKCHKGWRWDWSDRGLHATRFE